MTAGPVGRLRDLGRRIASVRASKRALAAQTRDLAGFLEPGIWLLPRTDAAVYVRTGRLPEHLRRTKVHPPTSGPARLRRALHALLPPSLVVIRRRPVGLAASPDASRPGGERRARGILFFVPPGRQAVVVDPRGTVSRIAVRGTIACRVVAIRHAFRTAFPDPAFELAADRTVLRESHLEGTSFDELPGPRRSAAFATLLERYAVLTRERRRGPRPEQVRAAFDAAGRRPSDGPHAARLAASRDAAVAAAHGWPCVPSHGDLWTDNLVAVGDGVCPIDFEFVDLLPFFFDVVKLALEEAFQGRRDLLDGLRHGGRFAPGWAELWRAAGHAGPPADLGLVATTVTVLYARSLDRRKPIANRRPLVASWLPLIDAGPEGAPATDEPGAGRSAPRRADRPN